MRKLAPLSTQSAPTIRLPAAFRHRPALPRRPLRPLLRLLLRLLRLLHRRHLSLPTASVDQATMDILA